MTAENAPRWVVVWVHPSDESTRDRYFSDGFEPFAVTYGPIVGHRLWLRRRA